MYARRLERRCYLVINALTFLSLERRCFGIYFGKLLISIMIITFVFKILCEF